MTTKASNHLELFQDLSAVIDDLIHSVDKQKLRRMATNKWTVKDVLCHIVFWHRYYAQNYASLAAGKKPFVFTSRGGSTRNQDGIDSIKKFSKKKLIIMLNKTHKSLYKSIVIKGVKKMSYTDRRKYNTEDFLIEITKHIQRHTIQVRRVKDK